jgi:hypothetical protein
VGEIGVHLGIVPQRGGQHEVGSVAQTAQPGGDVYCGAEIIEPFVLVDG